MSDTLYPPKVTYVSQVAPTTNYGSSVSAIFGDASKPNQAKRALISIDLSAYAGLTISAAQLRLYVGSVTGTSFTAELYRLGADFTEASVVWDDQPSRETTPTPHTFASPTATGQFCTIEGAAFLAIVQDAIDNRSCILAIAIRMQTEGSNNKQVLFNTDDAAVETRPQLIVTVASITVSPPGIASTESLGSPTVKRDALCYEAMYFGESADAPGCGKIQVTDITQLMRAGQPTLIRDSLADCAFCHGIGYHAGSGLVYMSTRTAPWKLIRYNLAAKTWSAFTAGAGEYNADALVIVGDYIYVVWGDSGTPTECYVDRFHKDDSPPVNTRYQVGSGYHRGNSICSDGTHLYIGTFAGYVLKVALSDPTTVLDSYDLGAVTVHAICYDAGKIYCASGAAGTVFRLSATDLAAGVEQSQAFGVAITDDMCVAGDYVYVGLEIAMPCGRVVKMLKTDLTSYTTIIVNPRHDAQSYGCVATPNADYVWCVGAGPGQQIVRLKVSDNSMRRVWLGKTEINVNELVFLGSEDDAWVCCWLSAPLQVVRLQDLFKEEIPTRVAGDASVYSYWAVLRTVIENWGDGPIDTLLAYSDGASGLGEGVSLKGNAASAYQKATGTPGQSGNQLTKAAYPSLADEPVDVFGWTAGSPKSIAGSVSLVDPVAASSNSANASTSVAVTKPAGVVDGDLMVAVVICSVVQTITPPAGWTLAPTGYPYDVGSQRTAAYYRVASSEGNSYTWSGAGSADWSAAISAYRGCDPDYPVESSKSAGAYDVVPPYEFYTPFGAGLFGATRRVLLYSVNVPATWTPPAGATERADVQSNSNSAAIADMPQVAPESFAYAIAEASAGGSGSGGFLVLRPATEVGDYLVLQMAFGPTAGNRQTATEQLTFAHTDAVSVIALPASVYGQITGPLFPAGVASAEAVGTPTIGLGGVTLSPAGIASAESLGTPAVQPGGVGLAPAGIASAENLGSPTAAPGGVTLLPGGIDSAESLGAPTTAQTLLPSGIASAEALGGSAIVLGGISLGPPGIASAESLGAATVSVGGAPQIVAPAGMASQEALGSPTASPGGVAIIPAGVGSEESLGAPTVTVGGAPQTVSPSGIASGEAVGTPAVSVAGLSQAVEPPGIGTAEMVGDPSIGLGGVSLAPAGIATAEALGTAAVLRADRLHEVLYFGSGDEASCGKVEVSDLSQLLRTRVPTKASGTLAGCASAHGTGYHAGVNRVYLSTRTSPYRLIRLNPDDLADWSYFEAAAGESNADGLVVVGDYIYVVFGVGGVPAGPCYIDRFHKDDSPPVKTRFQVGGSSQPKANSICSDGTYLYLGCFSGWLLKVAIADPTTIVDSYQIVGTLDSIACSGGKVFVATTARNVYRFSASSLAAGPEQTQAVEADVCDDMCVAGDYLYVGLEGSASHGRICKLSKTDLSSHVYICVNPKATSQIYGCWPSPTADYVWCACEGAEQQIVRVKVSDNSVRRVWLGKGAYADAESDVNEIALLGSEEHALVCCWLSDPLKVVRLDYLFSEEPAVRPAAETVRSYWAVLRCLVGSHDATIETLRAYTDGVSGLGADVTLIGNVATAYQEPTGTPGVTGTELSVASYPSLAGAPEDVFGWTPGSPKTVPGSLANIEPVNAASASANAQTSLTISKPSGAAADDVLVAIIACSVQQTITPPSGWAAYPAMDCDTNLRAVAYWRRVAAGEGSSYQWSGASSANWAGVISAYRNCEVLAPAYRSDWNLCSAGPPHYCWNPLGSVPSPNSRLVLGCCSDIANSWTPAEGTTERADVASNTVSVMLADLAVPEPGAFTYYSAVGAAGGGRIGLYVVLVPACEAGQFLVLQMVFGVGAGNRQTASEQLTFLNTGTTGVMSKPVTVYGEVGGPLLPTGIASAETLGVATAVPGGVTVLPTGVASAEALGQPTAVPGGVALLSAGIASAEALGQPVVSVGAAPQTLQPPGIASAENLGTPAIALGGVTLAPDGIASAEALGAPTTIPGGIAIEPAGVASGEALGTPSIALGGITLQPSGIASEEQVGQPAVALTLAAPGIASAEALGAPAIALGGVTVSPPAVASAESLGGATVSVGAVPQTLEPAAIGSGEALGELAAVPGGVSALPDGIASLEALGQPVVAVGGGPQALLPGGIESAEALGSPAAAPGNVALAPAGIGSEEEVGTPVTVQTLEPAGVGSAEAVGTPSIALGGVAVQPPGVASAEALGQPAASVGGAPQIVAPDGIATGEALGQPALLPGGVGLAPDGIASGESLGAATASVGGAPQTLQPEGLPSAEALGQPAALPGGIALAPPGVASDEALGSPTIGLGGVVLQPAGIASAESIGQPQVGQIVLPAGVPSEEGVGSATIALGGVTVAPPGIPTAEALGQPIATVGGVALLPAGIISEEGLGSPALALGGITVAPTGIASGEGLGQLSASVGGAPQSVEPPGIASEEGLGSPAIALGGVTLVPDGVASAEALGQPMATVGGAPQTMSPPGIASGESLGVATAVPGPITVAPAGITSAEAIGSPDVVQSILPSGIASVEALGRPSIALGGLTLTPPGIASVEALGAANVSLGGSPQTVEPAGIAPAEALGEPAAVPGAIAVQPSGVASQEALGEPTAAIGGAPQTLQPSGIGSSEALGQPTALPGGVVLGPGGIPSAEELGTPTATAATVLSPPGIASGEQVGEATVTPGGVSLAAPGIASSEALGGPSVVLVVLPPAIVSEEALGTPSVLPGGISLQPPGIISEEQLGSPSALPGGVTLQLPGVASAEALGTPSVLLGGLTLLPPGVASGEALGQPATLPGGVTLAPPGVPSEEALGAPELLLTVGVAAPGIASQEALGAPAIVLGGLTLVPMGVVSAEALGAVRVVSNLIVSEVQLRGERNTAIELRGET